MSDQEYLHAVLRAPVYEVAEKTPLEPMPNVSKRLDNTVLVKGRTVNRFILSRSAGHITGCATSPSRSVVPGW